MDGRGPGDPPHKARFVGTPEIEDFVRGPGGGFPHSAGVPAKSADFVG